MNAILRTPGRHFLLLKCDNTVETLSVFKVVYTHALNTYIECFPSICYILMVLINSPALFSFLYYYLHHQCSFFSSLRDDDLQKQAHKIPKIVQMSIIFGQLTSFSILEGRWDRMIHEHNSFALTRNSPNFLHITDKTFIRRVDLLFRCVCLNLSSQHIYIFFQLVSSDI